jgi:hypothetical protein
LLLSTLRFRDLLWPRFFLRPAVTAPFLHDARRFRLCSLDPRKFRHVAPCGDAVHTVELPASHLKEMIKNTTIAAAPDDTRGLPHTLLFALGEREHLCGVASDWTSRPLWDFARHCHRHLWRTVSLHD